MQPLLEPFEPPAEPKPLPILPISLALVTAMALAWVAWLACSFAQHNPTASRVEQPQQSVTHALHEAAPAIPVHNPPPPARSISPPRRLPAPLITVAPGTEPEKISISGAGGWQRPQTIDGSYFGQIDSATGLPKTIYLSEQNKYVAERTAAAGTSTPQRNLSSVQVHAPAAPAPDAASEGVQTGSAPTYFEFDAHMRRKRQN